MKKELHKPNGVTALKGNSIWSVGLTLLVFFILSYSFPLSAHEGVEPLSDVIKQVKPAVVAVGTMRPVKRLAVKRPPVVFRGSGFVVGGGNYVITNLHVLPDDLDYEADEVLAIFTGRGAMAKGIPVKVVREDPVHDLVLLKLLEGRLPALGLGSGKFVEEGTDVAFTGFPIGMVLGLHPVTHRGIVSAITPFVIPAVSSSSLSANQLKSLRDPFDVYQLDAVAYPGNSGSAVYQTDTGEVIGVVNSVFIKAAKESVLEHPSGITYVIPVQYVRELLDGLD